MILLIIGPPASGKGTQAEKIAKEFGIKHISTGEIFRKIKNNEISKYLVSGKLLPDEFVFKIVKENIDNEDNYILDGFPRTLTQAKMLDEFLKENGKKVDYVIYLKVSDKGVIKRITSRRVCSKCGKNYNLITNPLPKNNICKCGGEIIQREDDKEDIAKSRLEIFKKITQPILDYYKDKLIVVNGELPINDVFRTIVRFLRKK